MTRRVVIGNRGGGEYGIAVSRAGVDVLSTGPTDYPDLHFDSAWDRIERVHQAGSFSANFTSPNTFDATLAFPSLGYVPIISLRRKTSGNTLQPDGWYVAATGGDDPYTNGFRRFPQDGFFVIRRDTLDSIVPDATYYFNYIVWKLRADQW